MQELTQRLPPAATSVWHQRVVPVRSLMLAAGLAVMSAGAALASCRDDLVASQKDLQDSAAGIEQVAAGPDPARCPAHRRHYAALVRFRDVLNQCDKSKDRAERVVGLNTKIEGLRKQMPGGCRP
jgi:hypothetical protein